MVFFFDCRSLNSIRGGREPVLLGTVVFLVSHKNLVISQAVFFFKKRVLEQDNQVYISYFEETLYYLFIENSVQFCIQDNRYLSIFF